ncbi:MAG: UDP-N-acetylmuramoyl-tripeptide--D-alanyl-D-alanine ligase [Parcubacteria group bacterium]|nr:UDP-N-acetylmuramoyl-tripeptide--D-alanyl-D-alanine ligase [Parcubacteria group bacterium]
MKSILRYCLKICSRIILWKYKPKIISITGSVGKTSTKEAIFAVLSSEYNVRKSEKNYNNEIGLPLAILGLESPGKNIFGWLAAFFKAWKMIIFKVLFPEILILEMGADRPGDIGYFTSFIKSDVAAVTALGEIPVHVEFYSGPEEVAREKAKLVASLNARGAAILNYDDIAVLAMKEKTSAKIITYGFGQGADLRATDIRFNEEKSGKIELNFKLNYAGKVVPIWLPNILAKHQIYASLSAVACGIIFGMNLVKISEALKEFRPPQGRMNLIKGNKNTRIIDDTYNASPDSMAAALEVLGELKGKRKIAVLSDMLELGKYSVEAHQAIGNKALKVSDIIITVGERAKFIAYEARSLKPEIKVLEFSTSEEVGKELEKIIESGDLILVKGSQGMRMEKIVEEIMAEPEKAKDLLVRQEEFWKMKN